LRIVILAEEESKTGLEGSERYSPSSLLASFGWLEETMLFKTKLEKRILPVSSGVFSSLKRFSTSGSMRGIVMLQFIVPGDNSGPTLRCSGYSSSFR
jgi:hypothetical protein